MRVFLLQNFNGSSQVQPADNGTKVDRHVNLIREQEEHNARIGYPCMEDFMSFSLSTILCAKSISFQELLLSSTSLPKDYIMPGLCYELSGHGNMATG